MRDIKKADSLNGCVCMKNTYSWPKKNKKSSRTRKNIKKRVKK